MQGIVEDFLTSGQGLFIIPECLIMLDDGAPETGRHWYCDVAAVDLKGEKVLLCEVTYAKRPLALHKRLRAWADNWAGVRGGLKRDYGIPLEWEVLPQVFAREECGAEILSRDRASIAVAPAYRLRPLAISAGRLAVRQAPEVQRGGHDERRTGGT